MPATHLPAASALTNHQIRQYEADGYLVLPAYLDPETVGALSAGAEELAGRVGPIQPGTPRLQVDRIHDRYQLRMVEPVIDLVEAFARLAADERVLGPFRDLLGEEPMLFEDKLNYKHPRGGSPFPLHQDYPYWQKYTPRLISAMIYIDEATEANGCLEVVPGWHQRGILPNGPVKVGEMTDGHVCTEPIDPALIVKVPGPPGSVILFSCFTPHASAPNLSDRPRRALVLTYHPAGAGSSYEERYGGVRRRAAEQQGAARDMRVP